MAFIDRTPPFEKSEIVPASKFRSRSKPAIVRARDCAPCLRDAKPARSPPIKHARIRLALRRRSTEQRIVSPAESRVTPAVKWDRALPNATLLSAVGSPSTLPARLFATTCRADLPAKTRLTVAHAPATARH